MKKSTLSALALFLAIGGPAFAQAATAPAATTSTDPIVQMRSEQRAVNSAFAQKYHDAYAERSNKINESVAAAMKAVEGTDKDPFVAHRDAEAKAKKATQADFDAKVKPLLAARKAELAVIAKKYKDKVAK